jgi:hypothetical protein
MAKSTLVLVLTVANAVMLAISFIDVKNVQAQTVPAVLRARALEIVDDAGRFAPN